MPSADRRGVRPRRALPAEAAPASDRSPRRAAARRRPRTRGAPPRRCSRATRQFVRRCACTIGNRARKSGRRRQPSFAADFVQSMTIPSVGAAWCDPEVQERRRAERRCRSRRKWRGPTPKCPRNKRRSKIRNSALTGSVVTTAVPRMLDQTKTNEIEAAWLAHEPERAAISNDIWRAIAGLEARIVADRSHHRRRFEEGTSWRNHSSNRASANAVSAASANY